MLKEKYIVDLYDIENDLIKLQNARMSYNNKFKTSKINEYKLKTLKNKKILIEKEHDKKHNLYRKLEPVILDNTPPPPFSELKISSDYDIGNLFKVNEKNKEIKSNDIFKDYINYEPQCEDDISTGDIDKYIMCITEAQKKKYFLQDRKKCYSGNNIKYESIDDIADCLRKNYIVKGKFYLSNSKNNIVLNDSDIENIILYDNNYKYCKNRPDKIQCLTDIHINLYGDEIKDTSGNILIDGEVILEDDDDAKSYINTPEFDVTKEGIVYKLAGTHETGYSTSFTKCGETSNLSSTNKSEGYVMEIKHYNSDKSFKICIYGKGEIDPFNKKIKQITKTPYNTWYKYDSDNNKCVDWGVYIPHNNQFSLDKMKLTNKFIIFKRFENYGSVNKKADSYPFKRVFYDDKDFCESTNQKKLGDWYFYDNNIKGCRKYTSKLYDFYETDKSNIQFNRYKDGKTKHETKLNLYNDFRYCIDSNTVKSKKKYDAFKYDIKNNTCIFQGKFDDHLFKGGEIKNKFDCNEMIKHNSFIYDNIINECIENTLICDKYGNKKKCTLDELKNSGKDYYLNLDDCVSNDIKGKYYFFNPSTEQCEERKLTIDQKNELDAIINLHSTKEDCFS